MNLPQPFIEKMKRLLHSDFESFLQSYNTAKFSGLRAANGVKITAPDLKELLPYLDESIPWCQDGFYYDDEAIRPAKHPLYYAGLYYIQEPSAMLPAELLGVISGDRVLDLCAAPGGKSLQLAAKIGPSGLLVVNDINSNRAKVLLKNMERYGVKNVIVLNDAPDKIAAVFSGFFDKILVDAPCSGEGMFRKEPDMIKSWSEDEVIKYTSWQREILSHVPRLLEANGKIVYSTCTFSPEENEEQINGLLERNKHLALVEKKRLWPHAIKGEGHFVSLLQSKLEPSTSVKYENKNHSNKSSVDLCQASRDALADFSMNIWNDPEYFLKLLPGNGTLLERNGHILWESNSLPSLKGLKILRSGWLMGTIVKNRFKPSQAFSMGLSPLETKEASQCLNLASSVPEELDLAVRYLKGETIQQEGVKWSKGWYLISIDHYPLGWAKSAGLWLKNEYLPGWRWS